MNCLHFVGYQIPTTSPEFMLPTGVKERFKCAGLEPWFSTLLEIFGKIAFVTAGSLQVLS
jgi:hypothetical protein